MRIDIALLMLRIAFGSMMLFGHGLPKLFSFSEKAATWADPIGVGPQVSLALAIFAEAACSLGVLTGLFTRLATIPLIFTMLVAVIVVHSDDPWGKKELAVIYATAFTTILVAGPGRFSLDAIRSKIFRKKRSSDR